MYNYYNILSAYLFDEKDRETGELTGKKKVCITCNQYLKGWTVSRYTYRFYPYEDDFVKMFWKKIKPDEYNLGLSNVILKARVIPECEGFVDELPDYLKNK